MQGVSRCVFCSRELDCEPFDPSPGEWKLNRSTVVGHLVRPVDKEGVHLSHIGCFADVLLKNSTARCPECDQKISVFQLRRVHIGDHSLIANVKLLWEEMRRVYALAQTIAKPRSDLWVAVEAGDYLQVWVVLVRNYAAYFIEDAYQKEVLPCFRRAVDLLEKHPQAYKVVQAFVGNLPREWTRLESSSLDKALVWSIQAGSEPLFVAILHVRYPPDIDLMTDSTLLSIMKQIHDGKKPEKLQPILFEEVRISPYIRGKALRSALSSGDSDVAFLLCQGELTPQDRCEAIKLAIRMRCSAIVGQLLGRHFIEHRAIGECLIEAVKANHPESIPLFLKNEVLMVYLCQALNIAYNQGPEGRVTLQCLLEETPQTSREGAMTALELSGEVGRGLLKVVRDAWPHKELILPINKQ
jgi:hypothetical protein